MLSSACLVRMGQVHREYTFHLETRASSMFISIGIPHNLAPSPAVAMHVPIQSFQYPQSYLATCAFPLLPSLIPIVLSDPIDPIHQIKQKFSKSAPLSQTKRVKIRIILLPQLVDRGMQMKTKRSISQVSINRFPVYSVDELVLQWREGYTVIQTAAIM